MEPLLFPVYTGPFGSRRVMQQGNGFLNMSRPSRVLQQQGGNIFLNFLPKLGKWLLPIVAGGVGTFISGLAKRLIGGDPIKTSARQALGESAVNTVVGAVKKIPEFPTQALSGGTPLKPLTNAEKENLNAVLDNKAQIAGLTEFAKKFQDKQKGTGHRRKLDDRDGPIALYKADQKRIKHSKRIYNF